MVEYNTSTVSVIAHLLPPPLPLEQAANKARVGRADGSALPNASVRLVVVDALRQHQPRDRQRARPETSVAKESTRKMDYMCLIYLRTGGGLVGVKATLLLQMAVCRIREDL